MDLRASRPDQLRLLDNLPEFRHRGVLCDVSFRCNDGHVFPAHRLVLALASRPFEALVAGRFREGQMEAAVELEASSAVFQAVLSYIYEGRARVPLESLAELLRFVHMYGLDGMQEHMVESLPEFLNPELCMELLAKLGALGIHSLQSACASYALDNFELCMQSCHFSHCSSQRLLDLLESDRLKVSSEETVLKSIACWLPSQADEAWEHRAREAVFLVRAVRLPLLAASTRQALRRVAMGLGVLGSEIEHQLGMAGQAAHPGGTLRASFRGPFGEWGCAVQSGVLMAGTGVAGSALNQLDQPRDIVLDESDQEIRIYVTDCRNGRIMRWTHQDGAEGGPASGHIVAGPGAPVNGQNGLRSPCRLVIDTEGRLMVLHCGNLRALVIFRNGEGSVWNLDNHGLELQPVVRDIHMRSDGALYVLAVTYDAALEQTRWRILRWQYARGQAHIIFDLGSFPRTRAADFPFDRIFATLDGDVYILSTLRHSVECLRIGTAELVTVAGGQGRGDALHQLSCPQGIAVAGPEKTLYVADSGNHRIVSWAHGAQTGVLVAGGQERGSELHQLSNPCALALDRHGGVYIVDRGNARVVRWGPAPYLNASFGQFFSAITS